MGWLAILVGYLLGSIPTALLVSKKIAGVDIRTIGTGNMGSHNVKSQFGWKAGMAVGAGDFAKGGLAVLFARLLSLDWGWQIAALAAAVLGHDFPLFAGFRGGEGLATSLGGLTALAFPEFGPGMILYGLVYFITRNADLGASLGTGMGVFLMWLHHRPTLMVLGVICIVLMIPLKKRLDEPWREKVSSSRNS